MFQAKYKLSHVSSIISSKIDVLFLGSDENERSQFILNNMPDFEGEIIRSSFKKAPNEVTLKVENKKGEILDVHEGSLITVLEPFLKNIDVGQKNIFLDITSMPHVIFFMLTQLLLKKVNPKTFYAGYTEPLKYIKDDSLSENFNLSDQCFDLLSVPGFIKRDRKNTKIAVVFIGFEGYRTLALLENMQGDIKRVIPIVGFPSYRPGWKWTAIRANHKAISDNNCEGEIINCEAASPFHAYKTLEQLASDNEEELVIAPLGTRPHALGAAIFTSLNSHCQLVYDHPLEKTRRSEGVLRANVYDLTRFISEVC